MTGDGDGVTEQYRAVFRRHPAGVAIITGDDGAGPVGLTATSVISVSVRPARLAFSLSASSSSGTRITAAGTVIVHLLDADQVQLAKRFATGGNDRFADTTTWYRHRAGEPVLRGVDRWLRGRIVQQLPMAGANLVVVDVLDVQPGRQRRPLLVYGNRTWYSLETTAAVA